MKTSQLFRVLLFATLPLATYAQNMLGLTASPNGGTNRLYLNPAFVADTPDQFYINVAAVNANVDNDYVRYKGPYSLLKLITGNVPVSYRQPDGSLAFRTDYTEEIPGSQPRNGLLWGEVRGPALQIKLGERGGVAVTSRLRAIGQVTDASPALLSVLRNNLNVEALYRIPSSDNKFNFSTSTYSEVGLTLGYALAETQTGRLLAGVTAKYLVGYSGGYFDNRGLDYQITPDYVNRTGYLDVTRVSADLAYTEFLQNRQLTPGALFNSAAPGRGFGVDIGLTYIAQADADGPTLRVGAALNDIGGITYRGEAYNVEEQNIRFAQQDFNGVNGFEQAANVLRSRLGLEPTGGQTRFRQGLPTAATFTADLQTVRGFGVGLVWIQNVVSADAKAVRQPTTVAATPRYDTRWLGLMLPVLYQAGQLRAGLALRAGPVTVGTDNLFNTLGGGNSRVSPRGLDVYAGVAFRLNPSRSEE